MLSNGFVRPAQAVETSLSSRREDRLPQPWRKLSIWTPLAAIEFVWLARNCSFAEFLFSGDRFSMHSFNSIPHLDDRRLLDLSMKIWVYYIGKARDAASNAIAAEFLKRSSRYVTCEMREIHPDRFDLWSKHPSANKVLLDPAGRLLNSAQFIDHHREGRNGGQGSGVRHRRP